MSLIYLDNAATTPVDPRVFQAMRPYFSKIYANPASIHSMGQNVLKAIDKARQQAADFLNCQTQEIIFTSGATESNNLAQKGIIQTTKIKNPHIITSKIEHPAILEICKNLKNKGIQITYAPVNKQGIVNTKFVQDNIKSNTILVSIMYANNEIGTIQPIKKIGEIIKKENKKRKKFNIQHPISNIQFHTDAVQAAGYLNCNVKDLKVDLLSISAHKIYGPKGIGLLYIKQGTKIQPQQLGGHQEHNIRAGTLNVPGIVGLGKALELAKKHRLCNNKKIKKLRNNLIQQILNKIPGTILNGSKIKRLPNNANISFDKIEGESIMLNLDFKKIEVSTGSACASGSLEPSHTLLALGLSHSQAHSSIRFSLGKYTTKKNINYTVNALTKIVQRLRKISPIK